MMVNYQHSQQLLSSTTPQPLELVPKLNCQNSDNEQQEKPEEYETFKRTNNINNCISASSTNIKSSGMKLRSNKILGSSLSVLSSDSFSNLSSKVETENSTLHCPATTLPFSTPLISSKATTESRPKIAITVNGLSNSNSHYSSSGKSNQNLNPKSTNDLLGDEQTNHQDHNHHHQNSDHHYSPDLVIKNKESSPPISSSPFQNHNHLKNKKIRLLRSRTGAVLSTEPKDQTSNSPEKDLTAQLETKKEQKQELNAIQSSNNVDSEGKTLNNHSSVIEPPPKQRRRLKRPIWNNLKPINGDNQKANNDSIKNDPIENELITESTDKLVNDLNQTSEINHNHELINNVTLYNNVQINNNYQDLLRSSPMNISYDSDDTNSLTSTLSSNTLTPPLSYTGSGCTTTTTTMMISRNPIGLTPIAATLKSFCGTPIPPVTYDPNGYGVIEQPEQIEPAREPDDEPNKIFVGGLPWDTTEYDLEFYFSHFGKVTEINIKYDPLSCLTRGFCFVTFELEETVNLILKKPIHMIKGKMIELKRAKYRPICKKVFVGGLDPQITENDLKSYFSQYGTVIAIETPKDRLRNRKREFCFIIFESEFSAERACLYPKQFIGQRLCDVKKAQPQPICYQQKRMAQTLGLEISNSHLNKILLGESGRATISTPNGTSPASAIDCTAGTEALCPLAVTPAGTLFYYQPIAGGGNSSVTGSPSLTARVIPMATRPAVIGYPHHHNAYHHHHHQHPIMQSITAPPPPPPPAPPPTQSSGSAVNVTSQQNPHSHHHHHSYENSVASDFYVNYYAQTAAYYAAQQQQNQLSIISTSTQHQSHCWNNASTTTTVDSQQNPHQTLSSSSSSSSSNQVTSTNTPTNGKAVEEENNANKNDKNNQCTIESSTNTDNDKANTINNVTIIGKPTFNHNHHLLLRIGEDSKKNTANHDNT